MLNTKDFGNIAESIAITEFVKRGITVLIPFGDNAKYDLVADFNNKLNKIQVKYCGHKSKNGAYICVCESKKSHTNQKHHIYTPIDIDYLLFYIAEINQCVLVSINETQGKGEIYFRNDNKKTTIWKIKEHTIDNYIK